MDILDPQTLETLAEAAHKVWMDGKIRDGWKLGPETIKEQKIHNCLIQYPAILHLLHFHPVQRHRGAPLPQALHI